MVLRSLVVVSLVWPTLASNLMWFDAPTSIPIGNGRLGAQLMGEVPTETVALNEDRIWSGSLADTVPTTCLSNYPAIRNDVWEGQIADAQNSFGNFCMSNPLSMQSFQPAGNLTIAMSHGSTVSNYNHSLDLSSAIATTEYTVDGVTYTRSSFASNPDDVIVIQINASQPGSVSFTAGYITPMSNPAFSSSNSTLTLNAMGQSMEGLPASIKYTVQSNIRTMGSSANVTAANGHITVTNADSVTIVVAIATNFKRYDDLSGDPNSIVSGVLSAVSEKTFQSMLSTHLSDYQALYGRVDISLGSPTSAWYLPTDQRRLLPNGPDADADIFATYTQYGRYLAIASSRNTEPSNLQGVWNVETAPWWGSKYTLNINQQMNSWLLESLALPELLDPLWSMLDDVSVRGAETARVMYNASGWTVHHNTELWRDGPPIDGAFFGAWPFAGAWIAQHLFERYQFGLDVDFVRDTAYPLMKGLCEFYLDWLVDSPDGQYLTSNPSMSPEATFKTQDGISVSLTWGSTIDHSLMRDLFDNTVFFAGLLGLDSDFAAQVSAARARIYPWVLGSKGQIAEWASDTTVDIGEFSHMSHMYGLFPSAQIDPRLNATLASAAKMSLTLRGDSANGWPTAIRQNSWARLLDGEKAYYYFQRLLQLYSYANLWSYNDVWQIDANFGGASGLAEMLLQSHNGEVHLLPAVPAAWAQGSVSGFRARGGFAVDISWADGTLIHATLTSIGGTNTTVRYAGGTAAVSVSNGGLMTLTPASFNS